MAEDKIYKYKGKTIDELKALSIDEFALLLPSTLRRKIKRGFVEQEQKLLEKVEQGVKSIKTHCRDMVVLPNMVGIKMSIYNGKEFVDIHLVEEMVGMRFGQLVPTRKIATHTTMGAKRMVVRK